MGFQSFLRPYIGDQRLLTCTYCQEGCRIFTSLIQKSVRFFGPFWLISQIIYFIVFFGQTISPHFPSFSCFSTKNFSDLTIIYSKYWSKRVWEIVIMQSVFALLKERCRSNGCYKLHVLLATKHLP